MLSAHAQVRLSAIRTRPGRPPLASPPPTCSCVGLPLHFPFLSAAPAAHRVSPARTNLRVHSFSSALPRAPLPRAQDFTGTLNSGSLTVSVNGLPGVPVEIGEVLTIGAPGSPPPSQSTLMVYDGSTLMQVRSQHRGSTRRGA